MNTTASPWRLAARAGRMNPSAIREILNVTERPGILNFAGGLPSPETFPVDAMRAACARVLAKGRACPALQYADGLGAQWNQPAGGMFLWLRLLQTLDAQALPPQAVGAGMACVPGAPFYANTPERHTLRLSFATATPAQIDAGMAALGRVLRQSLGVNVK